MTRPFTARRTVFAEYQTHRNDNPPEDTQQEIGYLEKKVADLQRLVRELLVENERLRQSHKLRSD